MKTIKHITRSTNEIKLLIMHIMSNIAYAGA
jgi:hypothetical protein